jgi:hypothetical protein
VGLYVPGRPARKYTTDSDGVARIPASDFAPNLEAEQPESRALLVARRGQDSAFAAVSELIESWRIEVPTDFSGELRPYGVAFTERGIYRPGDEVQLKGIVRNQTATGNALPPEQALKVTLRSPAATSWPRPARSSPVTARSRPSSRSRAAASSAPTTPRSRGSGASSSSSSRWRSPSTGRSR